MSLLAALLPLEFSAHRSTDVPDTQLSEGAGILRTTSWLLRDARIRECILQRARWHTDGAMDAECAARLLTRRHTFPQALAGRVVRALPPPPKSRKQRDAVDRLQRRLESYPASCAGLLSLAYTTCADPLEIRGLALGARDICCAGAGILTKLPCVGTCYVQFVMEKPFMHTYFEAYATDCDALL